MYIYFNKILITDIKIYKTKFLDRLDICDYNINIIKIITCVAEEIGNN